MFDHGIKTQETNEWGEGSSVLIPSNKHAERVFETASQMKGNEPIRRFCGTLGLFN